MQQAATKHLKHHAGIYILLVVVAIGVFALAIPAVWDASHKVVSQPTPPPVVTPPVQPAPPAPADLPHTGYDGDGE